jgi:hypothetical protein
VAGFAGCTTVSGDAVAGVFSLFRKVIVRFNMVSILQMPIKPQWIRNPAEKLRLLRQTRRILPPFKRGRQNYQEPQLSRK